MINIDWWLSGLIITNKSVCGYVFNCILIQIDSGRTRLVIMTSFNLMLVMSVVSYLITSSISNHQNVSKKI